MTVWTGAPSIAQQRALAIVPKCTSVLSILASSYIIFDVRRIQKHKRTNYHHLLLGMASCDLVACIAWFLSTWPIPREAEYVHGATGTTQTCTAQGFLVQISISVAFYNGFLSLYYLLVVRFGWKDDKMSRWIAPLMHTIAIGVGLGTASASAAMGLLNYTFWHCCITPSPMDCKETWEYGYTDCDRGDNATLFQWYFFYGPIWIVILTVCVTMSLVYHTVLSQEKAMDRWRHAAGQSRARTLSNKFAMQATLYVASFFITWLFPTIAHLMKVVSAVMHFEFLFLNALFLPTHGFFSLLVYLRPRYLQIQERRKRQEKNRPVKTQEQQQQHRQDQESSHTENLSMPALQQTSLGEEEEEEKAGHQENAPSMGQDNVGSLSVSRRSKLFHQDKRRTLQRGSLRITDGGLNHAESIKHLFQDLAETLCIGDDGCDVEDTNFYATSFGNRIASSHHVMDESVTFDVDMRVVDTAITEDKDEGGVDENDNNNGETEECDTSVAPAIDDPIAEVPTPSSAPSEPVNSVDEKDESALQAPAHSTDLYFM